MEIIGKGAIRSLLNHRFRAGYPWYKKVLCLFNIHIYGSWTLTRYNPTRKLFTYHRECACSVQCIHLKNMLQDKQGDVHGNKD